jgi:hypothetical protein
MKLRTTIHIAAAQEARGEPDLALADLTKAIELKPRTIFDTMAQTNAKKRVQTLGKRIPCGSAGAGETCL